MLPNQTHPLPSTGQIEADGLSDTTSTDDADRWVIAAQKNVKGERVGGESLVRQK